MQDMLVIAMVVGSTGTQADSNWVRVMGSVCRQDDSWECGVLLVRLVHNALKYSQVAGKDGSIIFGGRSGGLGMQMRGTKV